MVRNLQGISSTCLNCSYFYLKHGSPTTAPTTRWYAKVYFCLLSSFSSSYGLTYLYSLFLAETLKYQYLLFDDNRLDEWVFINNAEAHPPSLFSSWRILIGRNSISRSSSFEWRPWLTNHPTAGPPIVITKFLLMIINSTRSVIVSWFFFRKYCCVLTTFSR